MRCPKFEENRNISRSESSLLLVERLVAMEKSKTQRGNFSTTYPNLLTPVKKIYFPMKFFAKLRKSCNPNSWQLQGKLHANAKFPIMFGIEGVYTVDYERVEKCQRHCRNICSKTIFLFMWKLCVGGGTVSTLVIVLKCMFAFVDKNISHVFDSICILARKC